MLISLIRNADRVKVGCMAQLVNVIAPIMTEPGGAAIRQTIFWPYLHCLKYGRGMVLRGLLDSPKYETKKFGETTTIDAVAVHDARISCSLSLLSIATCRKIARWNSMPWTSASSQ